MDQQDPQAGADGLGEPGSTQLGGGVRVTRLFKNPIVILKRVYHAKPIESDYSVEVLLITQVNIQLKQCRG